MTTEPDNIIPQKPGFFIFTAVGTPNLKYWVSCSYCQIRNRTFSDMINFISPLLSL
jgi:hypothetical protein